MKKILFSFMIIAVAGAVVVGGTTAFFSDTESSEGNTFTAGAIDLSLGGEFSSDANGSFSVALNPDMDGSAIYNFTDLKPGDMGGGSFNIEVNTNEAYLCARSGITATPENLRVDPEEEAGDTSDGTDEGELQDYLQFATFDDENENGAYDSGEPINVGQYGGDGNGISAAELSSAGWVAVADSSYPDTWIVEESVPSDTLQSAGMLYCFGDFTTSGSGSETVVTGCDGSGDYNVAQTDGIEGSIEFYAVQTRNNDDFTCASMNPIVIDAEGPFDGWNGSGELIWQAEGRFGNNGASGDWEVGVGTNTQTANQDNTNNIWSNGVAVPFSVSYDGANATFTVNGNQATYAVGAITSTADLNIIAGKVSAGVGDSVELSDLELDGNALNPDALVDTDDAAAKYLLVTSEDLSGGFELTGMVEFNWTSGETVGSRPAFQVQVRD